VQEALREGDTLVVWKLDRLGRSVKHLVDLVGELHQRGVQFKSLTDAIDTGTASGRFFFHVMASLAEMERELTIERTQAGLKVARQLGRTGGRKRQMTESKIKSARKLLASGVPPRDVAACVWQLTLAHLRKLTLAHLWKLSGPGSWLWRFDGAGAGA